MRFPRSDSAFSQPFGARRARPTKVFLTTNWMWYFAKHWGFSSFNFEGSRKYLCSHFSLSTLFRSWFVWFPSEHFGCSVPHDCPLEQYLDYKIQSSCLEKEKEKEKCRYWGLRSSGREMGWCRGLRRSSSPVRMAKSTVISRLKKSGFYRAKSVNCSNDYCSPGVYKNMWSEWRQIHTDLKSFRKPWVYPQGLP